MKSEPIGAELTPEEAADMLNVSVAYVIGLLDRGEIPCRYVEKADRRIKASNLVAYKHRDDADRRKVTDELTADAQEHRLGY